MSKSWTLVSWCTASSTKSNKFQSPLAGFYRPVEGAFSVFRRFRVYGALWRFLRLGWASAKVVLQLAYGGERGACAWPLRFPFKNPMYPAPERTQ